MKAGIEVLAVGEVSRLRQVPAAIVQGGEDIYLRYGWQDQHYDAPAVAEALEDAMRRHGIVTASGESRLAYPDDTRLAVTLNYRQHEMDFPMMAALLEGLKLPGGAFILWRQQPPSPRPKSGKLLLSATLVVVVAVVMVTLWRRRSPK